MDFTNAGKQIRKKRLELDMNQAQLAEKTNLSIDFISKIERGERIPKLPNLINILNTLDISADEVLGDYLNKGYINRISAYIDQIGGLPKIEQERIYSVIDVILKSR